jgi:uncharacterized protein
MIPESPLRSFLASHGRADLLSFDEVRGFIVAVAGTPELVRPSEWWPEAFNGEMPKFESIEQAQPILQELMRIYISSVRGGHGLREEAPVFREETVSNLEEDAAVSRWSRGFIRGYSWLRDVWNEFIPEDLDKELGSILVVLSFFSSRGMAEELCAEMDGSKSLDEAAETMREIFGDAMEEYVRLGRAIYEVRLEYERQSEEVDAKVGRNEPCPCGSGIKYKRCCGAPAD